MTSGVRDGSSVKTTLALAAILGWYLAATLPFLADYPPLEWSQMGIAAPAYKLATEGVYGNDLFTGFHRTELRNYEYQPAYPLLVAASFRVFGLGVWQARLVSVVCGLLTVALTFCLGRQLYGTGIGVLAAGTLCVVRFGSLTGSGITLVDYARWIRYDILVPVFVLAASILFVSACRRRRGGQRAGGLFVGTGLLTGLAMLTHVYGGFILAVFVCVLLWDQGWRALARRDVYLVLLGMTAGLLPWAIYVFQDLEAYRGQMTRHEGRFDLLSPLFYLGNLVREYHRYGPWAEGFPGGLLRPRLGIWVAIAGTAAGFGILWRRTRSADDVGERFLLVALPTLALLLALLVNLKRHVYVVFLLPFIALMVALSARTLWQWATHQRFRTTRLAMAAVAGLVVLEGGLGVARSLRAAAGTTPYREITSAIGDVVPTGARVLISQPYWMGLVGHETRSLNLAFVSGDSATVPEALRRIDADVVVVEREFFPSATGGSRSSAAPLWAAVQRYLAAECPQVLLTIPDATYGTIDVYACRSDTLSKLQ